MEKVNNENLENVAGGNGYDGNWRSVRAVVAPGTFLALRSQAWNDDRNILVQIQPGEIFSVDTDQFNGDYLWASAHNVEGWVNGNFIEYL